MSFAILLYSNKRVSDSDFKECMDIRRKGTMNSFDNTG